MADAKKEEPTKPTPEEKLAAAEAEVDALVKKGLKALDDFEKLDQKQVDRIVAKASVAALNKHLVLAKMAVEETGRGLVEDKATKNIFACEHVTNYLAGQKTVGIIREDDVMGIDEIAEPVGVVAGVTPVTNPTSTAIFKSLIALKTRCPIIFGFHPGAQKCSVEAAKIVRDAAIEAGAPENCIQWIEHPSIEATGALMKHDGIATIPPPAVRAWSRPHTPPASRPSASALATLRHMSTRTSTSCAPPTIWCSPSTSITA